MRWCLLAYLLLITGSGLVLAQQRSERVPHVLSLRRLESEHMVLYFTGDYREFAKPLLDEGERFLTQLAGRWSVILPKAKMEVSLGDAKGSPQLNHLEQPPWIRSNYDRNHGRVEIRILDRSRLKLVDLLPLFRHNLVHALLSLPTIKQTPLFLQEGLARHYAGESSGHTRLLAVLAFAKYSDVAVFFQNDSWAKDDKSYRQVSAMAGIFVAYLWAHHPEGEVRFVQSLQRGIAWRQALKDSGFPNWDARLSEFNSEVRGRYRWYTLIWTYDLWLILLSTLSLIWMASRVHRAWRVSRMRYIDIPKQAEPLDPEELKGPAFGQIIQPGPTSRALYPLPETIMRQTADMEERVRGSRVHAETQPAPEVDDIVPPPRPGASRSIELQPGQLLSELSLPEHELDDALSILDPQTKPQAAPPKSDKTYGEDGFGFEDELDDVFDSFNLPSKPKQP